MGTRSDSARSRWARKIGRPNKPAPVVAVDERSFKAVVGRTVRSSSAGRLIGAATGERRIRAKARGMALHVGGHESLASCGNLDRLCQPRAARHRRVEREHLYIDAGGVHFRNAVCRRRRGAVPARRPNSVSRKRVPAHKTAGPDRSEILDLRKCSNRLWFA